MTFDNFTTNDWAGVVTVLAILFVFIFVFLLSKCTERGKYRDPDELEEFLFTHGDLEGRQFMNISQYDVIHNHLKSKGAITSLQAIKMYGITRLAAVIYDLKKRRGLNISSEQVEVYNRYGEACYVASYKLVR